MSYFNGSKNALSRLWNDRVRIVGIQPTERGYITSDEDVAIVEDEPARAVSEGQSASKQSLFNTDEYDTKLITRNSIKIPVGAGIYVADVNGQMTKYKRTNKGYGSYFSHQEVAMVRSERTWV